MAKTIIKKEKIETTKKLKLKIRQIKIKLRYKKNNNKYNGH